MSFLDDRIKRVQVTAKHLAVELADGRSVRLPLSLFPTLAKAGPKARARWELCGAGTGIHWPLLNYDLSAAGLLRGEPEAPGVRRALKSGKYPGPAPKPAMALAEEPVATDPVAADGSPPVESSKVKMAAVSQPPLRPSALLDTRVIYCGDCLEQLRNLPDACVDLIYIDPPFNSNRNYEVFWGETKEKRAFEDRHASTAAYIDFMRPRCVELARVLKRTGSFYYHCDWHASHYVKVMLDQIFGEDNFQNEIVWKRSSAHSDSKRYGANHDTIFFYTGGANEWTWNEQFTSYAEGYLEQNYRYKDESGRKFRVSDMTANKPGGDVSYEWTTPDGRKVKPYKGRYWAYSKEKMKQMEQAGLIYYRTTGMPMLKHYLDEMPGVPLQTFWDDIKPVISGSKERLGYPTQKPLALLERILQASSNENDIVLDAFCGCGTALVAAQKLKRQWIGIDISPTACRVMAKRLRDVCGLPEDEALWKAGRGFIVRDLPWTEEKLRAIPPFEFENWAVIALGGIPNKTQVGDRGIDGRIYPVSAAPERRGKAKGEFDFTDVWYPIQVKQKDKAGRPDIDQFEAVMMREERTVGFFVAFDYSEDAHEEIGAFFKRTGRMIRALTVRDILDEAKLGMKLA